MKAWLLLSIGIGLLVGFGIGYATKKQPPVMMALEPVVLEQAESQATTSAPPSPSQEQKLLLQSIEELNLTTAELEESLAQLEAQKKKVSRYDWLIARWNKKGFGNMHLFQQFGPNDFGPNSEMIGFFDWDAEQVAEMRQAGKKTAEAIKGWESQNAVYVDAGEDALTYEVPAIPGLIKQDYLATMKSLIPPEDMELVGSRLEKPFEQASKPRTVSLTIGSAPANLNGFGGSNNPNKEWMTVKVIIHNQDESQNLFPPAPAYTTMQPYIEGRTIPHQWNHIFNLKINP